MKLFIKLQIVLAALTVVAAVWFFFWVVAGDIDKRICEEAGMTHYYTTVTFDGYCRTPRLAVIPVEDVVR